MQMVLRNRAHMRPLAVPNWHIAAVFMMLLVANSISTAQGVQVAASTQPPGGLSPADTPMFILWSHDDEVNAESTAQVLKISQAHRNPNSCFVPLTWFACTSAHCAFSCEHALSLHKAGHELGVHTRTHAGLRWYFEKKMIEDEVLGALDDIVGCGVPKSDVTGFRSPYLADSPAVREVLQAAGFRYDSSIGVQGGADKLWPATLEGGVPYDCVFSGNQCEPQESYPSMWEVPLYSSPAPDTNLMDYCTVEGEGSAQGGCSPFDVLKQMFDEAYSSNRAPVTIGVHKPYLQNSSFHADLDRFLAYALSQPSQDVWFVTHAQLLDWMEAPVPASQMKSFMAQYDCSF